MLTRYLLRAQVLAVHYNNIILCGLATVIVRGRVNTIADVYFIMEAIAIITILLSLLYYHIIVPGKPSVAVIVTVRPVTFSAVSDVCNKRFPYYYCLPRRPRLWLSDGDASNAITVSQMWEN